jgi:hypothetical protein
MAEGCEREGRYAVMQRRVMLSWLSQQSVSLAT